MEISEEDLNKKIADAISEATKGMLTQEQFNKTLSARINEEKEKHKKDLEEHDRIAKMTAEEKQKHDFETVSQERDALKKQLADKEHKEKILKLMSDKKIDSSFYEMFSNVADFEQASVVMDKFSETIKNSIDKAVEEKLKPNIPSTNPNNNSTTPNAAINNSIRAALGYSTQGD